MIALHPTLRTWAPIFNHFSSDLPEGYRYPDFQINHHPLPHAGEFMWANPQRLINVIVTATEPNGSLAPVECLAGAVLRIRRTSPVSQDFAQSTIALADLFTVEDYSARIQISVSETLDGYTHAVLDLPVDVVGRVVSARFVTTGGQGGKVWTTTAWPVPAKQLQAAVTLRALRSAFYLLDHLTESERVEVLRSLADNVRVYSPEIADYLSWIKVVGRRVPEPVDSDRYGQPDHYDENGEGE